MVKRPGLGKRVTQPQSEAADQPEQPDELPDTQASDPRGYSHPGHPARGHRGVGRGHQRHPVPWQVQEEEAGKDDRCPGQDG